MGHLKLWSACNALAVDNQLCLAPGQVSAAISTRKTDSPQRRIRFAIKFETS